MKTIKCETLEKFNEECTIVLRQGDWKIFSTQVLPIINGLGHHEYIYFATFVLKMHAR